MSENKISIIIADDHALLRAGLKRIIKDENDMNVAAEASSGVEVRQLLKTNEIDL